MRAHRFRLVLRSTLGALAAVVLLGCPVHQSSPARAQETANELNLNARFGRLEIANESVAPEALGTFTARRKIWGGAIRIADYEVAGFHMTGERDAEMLVKVSWYRMDQEDLRATTLKQKWRDFKGDWKLVEEERAEGDVGLFGEAPAASDVPSATQVAAPRTQFPTVRLGQGGANDPSGETQTRAE
jgi:hypothetical protein